jgi:hypothetical protein
MMNLSHADDFCLLWDAWERGCAEGLAMAIQMVQKQMRQEGISKDKRETLQSLYASLQDAKLRR